MREENNTKFIKEEIKNLINKGHLPIPFLFLEEQSKEDSIVFFHTLKYIQTIDGYLQLNRGRYFKPISRFFIAPYINFEKDLF